MKRRYLMIVCCTLILYTLTGCQLAKEIAGTNVYEDRLIGVFVTTEHLDFFNTDGSDSQKHQGRLYAVMVTKTLEDEQTGESTYTLEYDFEGMQGIQYCVPTIQLGDALDRYVTTVSDPAICDGQTRWYHSDQENSVSIDGTIYVTPSSTINTFYFNPVYQSADGSVYAVTGSGIMVNHHAHSEGFACSQTLETTTTITENGKAKRDIVSVKISISVMFTPEIVAIIQMDSDHAMVCRTEYEPDAMPQDFTLETDTAYFIVETHKRDYTGNMQISREIYGSEVDSIETFFVLADGVCAKHFTRIIGQ